MSNEIKVLDKGFVRLIDHYGDDSTIVQSARVSYGDGTKTKREDRDLIRYLVRHSHTSPLEQVEFRFHFKLPIFVARQIVRHRTANINEQSARYSVMKNEAYVPDELRTQDTVNKQGGVGRVDEELEEMLLSRMYDEQDELFTNYEEYIKEGVCREQARINLPLSLYTEWYWKMDLHNLFHFLRLRLDWHAQKETRAYAQAVYDLIKPIVPIACEAFEDYVLNSITFSRAEMEFLLREVLLDVNTAVELLNEKVPGLNKLERIELKRKLLG